MLGAPPEARPSSGVQLSSAAGFLLKLSEANKHEPGPAAALMSVARMMVKLFLLAGGLVSVLAFGWWLYCQNQNELGRSEWARVKADLEAKGEKLDWASFVPAPVPDAENFMRTPFMEGVVYRDTYDPVLRRRLSAGDAGSLTTFMRSPDDAKPSDLSAMANLLRTNLAPGRQWTSTNPAAMILEWLQPLAADFAELRAAAALPHSQLRFSLTNAVDPYSPSFVVIRVLAQNFAVLATAHLADGQAQLALEDIRVILALSHGTEDHGGLAGFLIASAIDNLVCSRIAEGLLDHRWNDQQLAELDRLLARIDLLKKYPAAIRRDRVAVNQAFDNWTSLSAFSMRPTPLPIWEKWLEPFRPPGWILYGKALANEILQTHLVEQYDPIRQVVHVASSANLSRQLNTLQASKHPRDQFAALVVPNFVRALEGVAKNQTGIAQARIATALERYRLAHGQLPDSLVQLGDLLNNPPHDLVSGEPLRYRRLTDDHYLLWAVGLNGVDEDGTVGDGKIIGDWVWFGF